MKMCYFHYPICLLIGYEDNCRIFHIHIQRLHKNLAYKGQILKNEKEQNIFLFQSPFTIKLA